MVEKIKCIICKEPFTPKHHRTVCCYTKSCREAYKVKQKINQRKNSKKWYHDKTRYRCQRCTIAMAKNKKYCNKCISFFTDQYADISGDFSCQFPIENFSFTPNLRATQVAIKAMVGNSRLINDLLSIDEATAEMIY